jgi:acyl-[acyl-carrier-protein] desaturase
MSAILTPDNSELKVLLYRMFRDFFARAERKRRWSLEDDIPWGQVNRDVDPAVAAVVESFCAVELYLPDYVAQALPMVRSNQGWAWFHVNWGYEESKHSLALGDWLTRSGARTEQQMADLQGQVFANAWELPLDSPAGMVVYAMTQELATWVNYRRLLDHVRRRGDPALERVLRLIAVDERAHHDYYRRVVKVFLGLDRPGTLEQLRRVLHGFAMPALYLLADTRRREAEIRELKLFDEEIFFQEVYYPILNALGVSRSELRGRPPKKSADEVVPGGKPCLADGP